ncbi:MAG: hypothetical protein RLZZ50_1144, partial [Verrucomicrobiota bacterium]
MTPASVSAISAPPVYPTGRSAAENRGRLRALLTASFFGDAFAVTAGLALASWLRFATPLNQVGSAASVSIPWTDYARHIIFGSALFLILLVG